MSEDHQHHNSNGRCDTMMYEFPDCYDSEFVRYYQIWVNFEINALRVRDKPESVPRTVKDMEERKSILKLHPYIVGDFEERGMNPYNIKTS